MGRYKTVFKERCGFNMVRPILRKLGYKPSLSAKTYGKPGWKYRHVYTDKKLTKADEHKAYKKILSIFY